MNKNEIYENLKKSFKIVSVEKTIQTRLLKDLEAFHPVKVGDIIEPKEEYYTSYAGGKMEVFKIWVGAYTLRSSENVNICFHARGYILKKDGSPGKRIGKFCKIVEV